MTNPRIIQAAIKDTHLLELQLLIEASKRQIPHLHPISISYLHRVYALC